MMASLTGEDCDGQLTIPRLEGEQTSAPSDHLG